MHIKRIHEMIESLTECTKEAIESDQTCVGSYPIGEVVDMIKDLADAEYHARIAKAMEEAEEDDKEEEKYLLKRLRKNMEMMKEDGTMMNGAILLEDLPQKEEVCVEDSTRLLTGI